MIEVDSRFRGNDGRNGNDGLKKTIRACGLPSDTADHGRRLRQGFLAVGGGAAAGVAVQQVAGGRIVQIVRRAALALQPPAPPDCGW